MVILSYLFGRVPTSSSYCLGQCWAAHTCASHDYFWPVTLNLCTGAHWCAARQPKLYLEKSLCAALCKHQSREAHPASTAPPSVKAQVVTTYRRTGWGCRGILGGNPSYCWADYSGIPLLGGSTALSLNTMNQWEKGNAESNNLIIVVVES